MGAAPPALPGGADLEIMLCENKMGQVFAAKSGKYEKLKNVLARSIKGSKSRCAPLAEPMTCRLASGRQTGTGEWNAYMEPVEFNVLEGLATFLISIWPGKHRFSISLVCEGTCVLSRT